MSMHMLEPFIYRVTLDSHSERETRTTCSNTWVVMVTTRSIPRGQVR